MTVAEPSTSQLAALIAAKLQLLELLAELGRRQLALIDGGEMSGLIKLLSAKQTVLEHLQAAERRLDPFRRDDPERRVWPSAAKRAACQAQADQCNALLAEALELEQKSEAAMLRRRDAAAAALDGVSAFTEMQAAYALPSSLPFTGLQAEG